MYFFTFHDVTKLKFPSFCEMPIYTTFTIYQMRDVNKGNKFKGLPVYKLLKSNKVNILIISSITYMQHIHIEIKTALNFVCL